MDRIFDVLGTPLTDIEIGAVGIRSILQNVKTIISTWRGNVFFDRLFGINTRMIDAPLNILYANLSVDITEQLAKYEPRVEVVSVSFEDSDIPNGVVIPLVRVRIRDGVLL